MTGENVTDVVEMVVLMRRSDGTQTGWRVFNAEASWQWAGIGQQGSRASVIASGDFHRMSRGEVAGESAMIELEES